MDETERREKLERLGRLDKIYIELLYYQFQGLSVPQVAEKLNRSEKAISARKTKIYSDWHIDGSNKDSELFSEYSPLFFEFFQSEEDLNNLGQIKAKMLSEASALSSQPNSVEKNQEIFPGEAPSLQEEELSASSDTSSEQPSITETKVEATSKSVPPQPTVRPSWVPISIGILVFCLLCGSGFLWMTRFAPTLLERNLTPTGVSETGVPGSPSVLVPTDTQPVLPSETSLPTTTFTAILPTETLSPTFTPVPPTVETSTLPPVATQNDWEVRIYRSDDTNIFVVNNHVVGGTFWRESLDWTGIDSRLQEGATNYVAAVNLSGNGGAVWGFSLRHKGATVWGNEGDTANCGLCYDQTVQISPDNTVTEVNLRDASKPNLGGSWSVKILANDWGVIMVNGVAVAGSYSGKDLGWADISSLLYQGQDNVITASIWNEDGDFSWDVALRNGETVVRGFNDNGSGQSGEVFFTTIIVDGNGNVK
jgi:hypothetical protein